ncbi:MAG: hypothetical protein GX897_00395 [Clostridiales bacterium]|nr:hypothetical protein [Clostridiales bacterium]
MNLVKRFIALTLALLMLAGLLQVIFAAPKVGDVVDHVLHTDIVTYINGLPIRSYNIKGYTAVIVEDLSNYGFYVVWYGTERELTVRPLASGQLVGGYTPEKNTQPIGSKAMPVYFTDIVTYLDGVKVDSYNVGGRTIIYVDDLAKFYAKDYVWNPEARTLSLTLKGASPGAGSEDNSGSDSSGGPVIEKQPIDCNVKEGDFAIFKVTAAGDGLKYQWQRDERDFKSIIEKLERGDRSSLTDWNWVDLKDDGRTTGANHFELTVLADLETINSGSYRCVITDSDGRTVTSDYASIIPISPGIKITEQPQDKKVKAGEYATLYVGAEGRDLKYQWQELIASYKVYELEDGKQFAGLSYEYKNITDNDKFSGTTTNTLTVKVDTPSQRRFKPKTGSRQEYICLITDRYGMTISSSPAKINSYCEIMITEQPKSVTQTERVPAELNVKAEGDSPLSYRWQFVWLGSWTDIPKDNPKFAGVDTPTLTWNCDSGSFNFRCVVDGPNSEPVISDEVTITYNLPPEDIQIRQPKNFRGRYSEQASFDFAFTNIKVDSLECRWQQKGDDGVWTNLSVTDPTLRLEINSATSGRWYRCTGKVNGRDFTTMPALLEGTLNYRKEGRPYTTWNITTNGSIQWFDLYNYIEGDELTFRWEGHKEKDDPGIFKIIEPEYFNFQCGSETHIIITEVNGAALGISTTGTKGIQPLYKISIIHTFDLYTQARCYVTDKYGEKLVFNVYIEYIEI